MKLVVYRSSSVCNARQNGRVEELVRPAAEKHDSDLDTAESGYSLHYTTPYSLSSLLQDLRGTPANTRG